MHIKLIAADKTDVGKQRDQNEDKPYKRIETFEDGDRALFICADGMGGYKAGEVASTLAVENLSKALDSFFKPLPEQPTIKLDQTMQLESEDKQKTTKLAETSISQDIEERLSTAIQQANRAILRYGEQQSAARGLGCTVTAVLIENDRAYIANVGDSRTYLLRGNELVQLTKDHSLVARLVESKQIDKEDVYTHPQRNLIYRSLGAGHKNIEVDIFQEVLCPGDTLLLCSDGLWEMVRDEDILKTLSEHSNPQQICNTLIDMANDNGGEDNITAVVVHISEQ
ncbi:MAG: Stp1/IreP family PP2C-type Ser/Thr phosphatase [Chloroflexi bacterium]|nr:Stp1/IreP family PP2C-type Ser/Thr phosphatase [Ktedonobacteraceae bacterium]MBV9021207.1 Stp1/IreP family PP2C-type Ser/Thr phosphatase [Ktedonobacteraceae bacterium]MBV9707760.1 Stp1/IreP family PP2C-type Ser/Thr phosphatase [Chloroflexota bacterium]